MNSGKLTIGNPDGLMIVSEVHEFPNGSISTRWTITDGQFVIKEFASEGREAYLADSLDVFQTIVNYVNAQKVPAVASQYRDELDNSLSAPYPIMQDAQWWYWTKDGRWSNLKGQYLSVGTEVRLT